MKEFKAALAGSWHVHGFDFAKKLAAMPQCRVTMIYDGAPGWEKEFGCRKADSYEELLDSDDVDGIILASTTALHEKMIVQAAQAGKHVFVEKALTISDEAAERIASVVEESGIQFALSDPVMKAPQMLAKQMMENGDFGRILNVRVRYAHDAMLHPGGPEQFYRQEESGGGAMIDMGHKAAHVLYELLGMPEKVCAVGSAWTETGKTFGVEDMATALYCFRRKPDEIPQKPDSLSMNCAEETVIGVAECAWTAPKYQNSLEILGTEGCFYQIDDKVFCRKGTEAWKEIPKEQLPEPMAYPLTDWAKHILNGTKSGLHGVEEAAAIVKMLTAAYRSKGNMVSVKD